MNDMAELELILTDLVKFGLIKTVSKDGQDSMYVVTQEGLDFYFLMVERNKSTLH